MTVITNTEKLGRYEITLNAQRVLKENLRSFNVVQKDFVN